MYRHTRKYLALGIIFCMGGMTSSLSIAQSSLEKPALGSAFTFMEILEKGGVEKASGASSVVSVDINSNVRIGVDGIALAKAAVANKTIEPFEDLSQKRNVLLSLLDDLERYLEIAVESEQLYQATHDLQGFRLDNVDLTMLTDLLNQQSRAGKSFLRRVNQYVAVSRDLPVPESLFDLEDFGTPLFLPVDANLIITDELEKEGVNGLHDPALPAFINAEINKVDEEAKQRHQQLLSDASVGLRLQARLIKENGSSEFIHLPGYDSLKAGVSTFVNRLSFALNEQQKADLEKENAFNTALSIRIKSIQEKTPKLRSAVASIMGSVKDDLDILRNSLGSDQLRRELLEPLRVLLQEQAANGPIRAKIETLEAKANSFISSYENLIVLSVPGSLDEGLLTISSLQTTVNELIKDINNINLDSFFSPVDTTSIPSLLEDLVSEVASIAQEQVRTGLENRLDTVREFTNKFTGPFLKLNDQAKRLLILRPSLLSVGDNVDINAAAFEIPLNDVQDTELQIVRTNRLEGDLIQFTAELLGENGVISEYSQLLRVETFGLHTNVSASLFFVNRLDDKLVEGVEAVDFVAVPGVSYLFEFTSRGRNGFGRFWNAMNPGIGFTTALLTFEGSDPELGLGVAGSLFGGVLEAGYGYNFQVDAKKGYFYIGFDVFEAMSALRNP